MRGAGVRAAPVLAVAAVFVKPGLAYVLGAVLLADTLTATPARAWWRALWPATATAATFAVGFGIRFGWGPMLHTLFPSDARAIYIDQNCGFFFGDGRTFWMPPHRSLAYYLLSPAGAWLWATMLLLVGAVVAGRRWRHDPAARVVVGMAVLHVVFVGFLFGNRYTWAYSSWLPFVGAVVVADRLPRWLAGLATRPVAASAGAVLAALAACQVGVLALRTRLDWSALSPDPRLGGLYATPDVVKHTDVIRARAADGGAFVLCRAGCVGHLLPGVGSPTVWYLNRAVARPGEWQRVRAGIARARWLIVPDIFDGDLLSWPELADVLAPFKKADRGPGFDWYRRAESPTP